MEHALRSEAEQSFAQQPIDFERHRSVSVRVDGAAAHTFDAGPLREFLGQHRLPVFDEVPQMPMRPSGIAADAERHSGRSPAGAWGPAIGSACAGRSRVIVASPRGAPWSKGTGLSYCMQESRLHIAPDLVSFPADELDQTFRHPKELREHGGRRRDRSRYRAGGELFPAWTVRMREKPPCCG